MEKFHREPSLDGNTMCFNNLQNNLHHEEAVIICQSMYRAKNLGLASIGWHPVPILSTLGYGEEAFPPSPSIFPAKPLTPKQKFSLLLKSQQISGKHHSLASMLKNK